MRLRRIDIYVIKAFMAWFGVSLLGIVGFYLVFDLFMRLHKFFDFEKSEILGRIVTYYLWHTPYQLTQFLPLVTLMGAMFALARMAKSNELIPIMSSGISLHRVVGIIFVMAFFVMLVMYGIQELFMPTFADKVVEAVSRPRDAKSIGDLLPDSTGHILHYRSYDPNTQQMTGVTISRLKSDDNVYGEWEYIYADIAKWGKVARITLKDGRRLDGFMHTPSDDEVILTNRNMFRVVTKDEIESQRGEDDAASLRLKSGTIIVGAIYTPKEGEILLRNGKRGYVVPESDIVKREEVNAWILSGDPRSSSEGVRLDYETMQEDRASRTPRQWQHTFGEYTYAFVTSITPRQAVLKRFDPSYETLFALSREIKQYPDYEVWRVALFARLVDPLTNMVLLLVGIPFVLSTERRSMFLSLGKCVLIFLVYYIFTFVNHNLGETKHLPPWVAVSLPLIMFAAIGLYLFDRVRT
jgi:lipopolysaccharide export LptBFGC system permease protein LptF